MKILRLGVIAKADDGKVYQVLLTNEQLDQLKYDLIGYFKNGKVKLLDKPLEGVDIEEVENIDELKEKL